MILLRRVTGDSMLPALAHNQVIVAVRFIRPRPGNVIVIHHEGLDKIKRLAKLQDGGLFVLGDNPAQSKDSRTFGWLPRACFKATVIWPRVACRRTMSLE